MDSGVSLLLTGTVNPNGMHFTELSDIETRKSQYLDAIKYWIANYDLKVVFVENSNVDLKPYLASEIETGRLEVLSFNGNDYPRSLGKGFGEMQCFKYAAENSDFIKKSNFVFKVTGRHKILNLGSFVEYFENNPDVNLLLEFRNNLKYCDSRFFGFSPAFVNSHLLKYTDVLDDSKIIFFEHVLAKAALEAIINNYKYLPLPFLPRIEGSSGTFNVKYNSSFLAWARGNLKYRLRDFLSK